MPWKRRTTDEDAQQEPEREEGDEATTTATETAEDAGDDPLAALSAEVAEWKDRCLRAAADMENVRRRARLDAEEARKFANERLVSELLPVLDNFGRALDAADQTEDFEALRTGVQLIHRQLDELLTRAGLVRIEAEGQTFDPNLHEAIMQVEPEGDQPPHLVVQELRPGYRLNDRVVRPSLVKVTSG